MADLEQRRHRAALVTDRARAGVPIGAAWDLAPDGKRVAAVTPVESVEAIRQEHQVVFLQNFFDELRRRVPQAK